jgi:hypothetical protein
VEGTNPQPAAAAATSRWRLLSAALHCGGSRRLTRGNLSRAAPTLRMRPRRQGLPHCRPAAAGVRTTGWQGTADLTRLAGAQQQLTWQP